METLPTCFSHFYIVFCLLVKFERLYHDNLVGFRLAFYLFFFLLSCIYYGATCSAYVLTSMCIAVLCALCLHMWRNAMFMTTPLVWLHFNPHVHMLSNPFEKFAIQVLKPYQQLAVLFSATSTCICKAYISPLSSMVQEIWKTFFCREWINSKETFCWGEI